MSAAPRQTENHGIQSFGTVFGENHIFGTAERKEIGNRRTRRIHAFCRFVSHCVSRTPRIRTVTNRRFLECLHNCVRLRIGCRGIIEVNHVSHFTSNASTPARRRISATFKSVAGTTKEYPQPSFFIGFAVFIICTRSPYCRSTSFAFIA